MAFHEVQFPTDISYGSRGGPGFSTGIVQVDSGAEERTARWNTARRRYNARYGVKDIEKLDALRDFYICRQGPAYGFRFKDYTDFSTASDHRSAPAYDDETIGVGDSTTTQFQIRTTYTSGLITRTRNITKPIASTVKVGIDGVNQASGWSANDTTGIITFTSAPGNSEAINAGCEYDVPVRFGSELDDALSISIDEFDTGGLDDIPIIEIRDELAVQDEFFFGGAKDHGDLASSQSITLADGRVHRVNPQGTGLALKLPDELNTPLGGPHFFIVNVSPTNSIEVQDNESRTIVNIGAESGVTIVLGITGATIKTWFAL